MNNKATNLANVYKILKKYSSPASFYLIRGIGLLFPLEVDTAVIHPRKK
ncbi:hypothetical protein AAJ76_1960001749 [Vairimorpha ceranae]|uniref:Uncharacterized protein n=1 Tax=Vairimorpha ceranae TaxID=40302 RepID=A0A0F9YM69_9MICR|nr:hypothetical protein AAJ76_1960001749 [Vairimorpha ceranae]KKO73867.1 hypothetical protein AAJ76_1960001749 [Vairimorpha ceranae]